MPRVDVAGPGILSPRGNPAAGTLLPAFTLLREQISAEGKSIRSIYYFFIKYKLRPGFLTDVKGGCLTVPATVALAA
jgi:hypothetical protein